jgi:hypothetical protein
MKFVDAFRDLAKAAVLLDAISGGGAGQSALEEAGR